MNLLSEGIPTDSSESEVLTKAFEDITGIKVNHQILQRFAFNMRHRLSEIAFGEGEGEVVQAQMQTGRNLFYA